VASHPRLADEGCWASFQLFSRTWGLGWSDSVLERYPRAHVDFRQRRGLHEHIQDVCRRLAQLGYLAIAPELFARIGDVSKLSSLDEIRVYRSTRRTALHDAGRPRKRRLDWLEARGMGPYCCILRRHWRDVA
jgi:hypothetical protein